MSDKYLGKKEIIFILFIIMAVGVEAGVFEGTTAFVGNVISDIACDVGVLGSFTNGILACDETPTFENVTIKAMVFNTSGITTASVGGRVSWNPDDHTLNVESDLGNVLQVGQEFTLLSINGDSIPLLNGQVVALTGVQGDRGKVARADASNPLLSSNLAVVTIPSCSVGAECPVTLLGRVRGVDTSAFSNGTLLFLSDDGSGNLTDIVPDFPNYRVLIGAVIRSHINDGILLVGPRLDYTDGVTVNSLGVITNLTINEFLKINSGQNITIGLKESNDFIATDTLAITMNNPNGIERPSLILQPGGAEQASIITRSFMIVNDNPTILNGVNATSCRTWIEDEFNETMQIDCNTTGTGADLVVGDDMQVLGDVWIKDTDGDWHFMTRSLTLQDELNNNLMSSRVNTSLSGTTLTITDEENETIIVTIDKVETIMDEPIDTVIVVAGTNESPVMNVITYQNSANPTLTRSATTPVGDNANVARLILGSGENVYGSIGGRSAVDEFIRGTYLRFFKQGALYESGFQPYVNTVNISIGTGVMTVLLDSHNIDSVQDLTVGGAFLILENGTYSNINTVDEILEYSSGESIGSNKYFNVVWGIIHNDFGESRMMGIVQSKPSSEYTTLVGAEADSFSSVSLFPSNAFLKNLFIPVARTITKRVGGTDEFATLSTGLNYIDERGATSSASAPASPAITDHSLLNNLDYASAGHTGFAAIGDCPPGEFVQNTTEGGVECVAPAGGGTVTQVNTDEVYITGGPITSTGTITFNDTKLNITIDARDTDTTYTASGVLLDLSGTVFSINEGTLTDENICTYESTGTQLECTTPITNFVAVTGDTMTGGLEAQQGVNVTNDNVKSCWGTDNDGCIYYNGTHLIIS